MSRTYYHDSAANVLYIVSGLDNAERMADIVRAARLAGVVIKRVHYQFATYHRPFSREIRLEGQLAA